MLIVLMFFGYLYNCSSVCPDPVKVDAIADMPAPNFVKETQEFVGNFVA